MKKLLAIVALAAVTFLAGCRTSGSIGIGYQSPKLHQSTQSVVVTPADHAR